MRLDSFERAGRVAQALAHPMRLYILSLLREEGSAYVMHLTASLERPQANISQHLAILREAGLVVDERDGMSVIYRVKDRRVFDLLDLLDRLTTLASTGAREEAGGRGMTWPERPRGCGCPRCRGQG